MHAQTANPTTPHAGISLRRVPNAAQICKKDSPNILDEQMRLIGTALSYPRNTEIFGENEPADYLYKVISGSVRTYTILSDGRRQVGGFYLAGDTFGLEFAEDHSLSAETIADSKVLVVKRSALHAVTSRDVSIAQEMFALTGRELRRAQEHILLLVKSAQERVASFLLEMSDRISGNSDIELPMCRQDIADYLGLTIETVSRTFTGLEKCAAIEVPASRRIVLRNRPALNRMNG